MLVFESPGLRNCQYSGDRTSPHLGGSSLMFYWSLGSSCLNAEGLLWSHNLQLGTIAAICCPPNISTMRKIDTRFFFLCVIVRVEAQSACKATCAIELHKSRIPPVERALFGQPTGSFTRGENLGSPLSGSPIKVYPKYSSSKAHFFSNAARCSRRTSACASSATRLARISAPTSCLPLASAFNL
jgi:hypothetical protein